MAPAWCTARGHRPRGPEPAPAPCRARGALPRARQGAGAAAELTPAVSPEGLRVVYSRRLPNQPESTIWLTPLDGGLGRQLSSACAHQDTQPVWSPDGRRVAFVRGSTGGPRDSTAMVVDVAGGQEFSVLTGVVVNMFFP